VKVLPRCADEITVSRRALSSPPAVESRRITSSAKARVDIVADWADAAPGENAGSVLMAATALSAESGERPPSARNAAQASEANTLSIAR
jgi:hypothetical protein